MYTMLNATKQIISSLNNNISYINTLLYYIIYIYIYIIYYYYILYTHIYIYNASYLCLPLLFQKATRRGMSVRKNKKGREYTSMKSIGVKCVDETFKIATSPLRDATDLRDNVQLSLASFKETCGLAPISNIKQCIRMIATRALGAKENVTLQIVTRADVRLYILI